MAQETFTTEQFFAECEALGEDKVRIRLAGKIYGEGNHKKALAQEWLRLREQARVDQNNEEMLRTAVSSKDAAWVSAAEAKKANKLSVVALAVAALALAIAFAGLFIGG